MIHVNKSYFVSFLCCSYLFKYVQHACKSVGSVVKENILKKMKIHFNKKKHWSWFSYDHGLCLGIEFKEGVSKVYCPLYILAALHTWFKKGISMGYPKTRRAWGFVMTSDFSARFIVAISIDIIINKCCIRVCKY